MLTHELLLNKGFSLNTYPQGKYYEFQTTEDSIIEKILITAKYGYDPSFLDETVILQMKEDFTRKIICIDGNVWDLTDEELDKILEVM